MKTYEIRTLADIYNLPTMEAMETCLDELTASMIQARATNDLICASAEALGHGINKAIQWPEVSKWIDDGKGEIVTKIKANDKEVLRVTSKPASDAISRKLAWHTGPAKGGGGTAQDEHPNSKGSWWVDGDLLLIVVELQSEDFVRLVYVNADGDTLCFQDPDSQDDIGFGPDDISWWARIEESLPNEK